MKQEEKGQEKTKGKKENFPGYPHYSQDEDIYAKAKEETDLDPEDPSQIKAPNEKPDTMNEKDFNDVVSGDDLDVPGNEQDNENVGGALEDEENNYYSLGGDAHENLEEDQGK